MFAVLAAPFALANWYAVERKNKALEYVAKPATTLCLLLAAITLTPVHADVRPWVVAGLALCLAGDVFLMFDERFFVPGLASFLVGHISFIVGFLSDPEPTKLVPLGALIAIPLIALLGRPIVAGARATDKALFVPVLAYIGVIATMLVTSFRSSSDVAILGALVFVSSDCILARNRFVKPIPHGHLLTMVTYHAALALLTLSLVR